MVNYRLCTPKNLPEYYHETQSHSQTSSLTCIPHTPAAIQSDQHRIIKARYAQCEQEGDPIEAKEHGVRGDGEPNRVWLAHVLGENYRLQWPHSSHGGQHVEERAEEKDAVAHGLGDGGVIR